MPSSRAGKSPMQLPFPCNDKGITQTETTLRVASHTRVFALGDVATVDPSGSSPSPQLPPTAQVRMVRICRKLQQQARTILS